MKVRKKISSFYDKISSDTRPPDIYAGQMLAFTQPDLTLDTWKSDNIFIDRYNINQVVPNNTCMETTNVCECKIQENSIFNMTNQHDITYTVY